MNSSLSDLLVNKIAAARWWSDRPVWSEFVENSIDGGARIAVTIETAVASLSAHRRRLGMSQRSCASVWPTPPAKSRWRTIYSIRRWLFAAKHWPRLAAVCCGSLPSRGGDRSHGSKLSESVRGIPGHRLS